MQLEITDPLGADSIWWTWTPEMIKRAPVPYSEQVYPLEYRVMSSCGVGSEIGTVTDFARFVAAAITGQTERFRDAASSIHQLSVK